MARNTEVAARTAEQLFAAFMKLPLRVKIGVVIFLLIVGVVIFIVSRQQTPESSQQQNPPETAPADTSTPGELGENVPPTEAAFPPGSRNVVFCAWNVENLFDDRDDHRRRPDDEYDAWFAQDPHARALKYQHLAGALVNLNGGNGPDVIAANEVETVRAGELLKETLNASLPAGAARYEHLAMKELSNAGRHIAPCMISRYPVERVRILGHRQRILEAHLVVNGHDLSLVVAHWTSQLSDDGSRKDGGRHGYAAAIADVYRETIRANTKADFLVCGDFNDVPESDAIRNVLHLVSDSRQVTVESNPPNLFGVLSGRPANDFGTYYYKKPLIYDHVGLSPGMFDNVGWGYAPNSVGVPSEGLIEQGKGRHPWRFGSRKDVHTRGYSDHLPVVLTLKVAP